MAVNTSRSQNADLAEGMSDGKYKKLITDRGGKLVNNETVEDRRDLSDSHFDIHEAPIKHLGDGTVHGTPDFRPNPLQPGGASLH